MPTRELLKVVARGASRPASTRRSRRPVKDIDPAVTTSQYFWPFFSPDAAAQFPSNLEVNDKINMLEWLLAIAKAMREKTETGYRADKPLTIINPSLGGVGRIPESVKEILQASGWPVEEKEGGEYTTHIILTPIGLAEPKQQEEKGDGV